MSDAREHILNISLDLFLQKSFKEVTTKEISEKTGLSKGALYHYFKSKEDVFEQVIKYAFHQFIIEDYGTFSQDSLLAFYKDCLKNMDKGIREAVARRGNVHGVFNINHYFILFDAMKILPGFKEELLEAQKKEAHVWVSIIDKAIQSGEISTKMTAEQIAGLFIYTSDGAAMGLIMNDKLGQLEAKLGELWDALYHQLKT